MIARLHHARHRAEFFAYTFSCSLKQGYEVGAFIPPVFQVRKLSLEEVKQFVIAHTRRKSIKWNLKTCNLSLGSDSGYKPGIK